jgi:hypothetical protein
VIGMAVSITSGIGQGLIARTDGKGEYALYGAAGTITLTFSKNGYTPITQSLVVQGNTHVPDVMAQQVIDPASFAGTWHITLTRSLACASMPDDTAVRSYDAAVEQAGARATIKLTSPVMWKGRVAVIAGRVIGNTLEFPLSTIRDDYYAFYSPNLMYDVLEVLDDLRFLGVRGNVTLDGTTGVLRGTLDGSFDIFAGNSSYWSARLAKECAASDHAVVMAR